MTSLKPATALEKVAGHTLTEATLNAIATLSGTPLAAVLPVLSNTLASKRHTARVEAALIEVDVMLTNQAKDLQALSDSQYKLVNETILALLHTVHVEKIEYLKKAIRNSVAKDEFKPQEAVALSRIVRDISADEATFLVNNFSYDRIWYATAPSNIGDELTVLSVKPETQDGLIVSGLVSLGLLSSAESTWDDVSLYRFSPIVSKLLVLLR